MPPRRSTLTFVKNLKGYSDVVHLFGYGIAPETVVILPTQLLGIVDATVEFHSVFVSRFSKSGLHLADYHIALLQRIWDPPGKRSFI